MFRSYRDREAFGMGFGGAERASLALRLLPFFFALLLLLLPLLLLLLLLLLL